MKIAEPATVVLPAEAAPFPADLGAGADRTSLARLALEIAWSVDGGELTPVTCIPTGESLSTRALLALVLYHYSAGCFGSDAIGEQLAKDAACRLLWSEESVEPECLRRFRRLNREVIQRCLERLLGRLAQSDQPESPSPTGSGMAGEGARPGRGAVQGIPDGGLGVPGGTWLACEATRRLRRAAQLDSMALDE